MPDPQVTTTERLWSDEVGIARAGEGPAKPEAVYEWSNGRTMVDPADLYSNTQQPGKGTDENP